MDLNVFFARYKPYIAMVAAIAALFVLMPGDSDEALSAVGGTGAPLTTGVGQSPLSPGSGVDPITGSPVQVGPTIPGARVGDGAPGGAPGQTPGSAGPVGVAANALDNPECDPATGRIRIPSAYAPPCVPAFNGDNGGATSPGVTATSIKLVYFQPQSDPAVDAALTAAGAQNTPEEQVATVQGYVELLNAHYETYGRKVELVVRKGSGDAADDAIGRADALAIASEEKPFAVIGASNASFVEELAARGIICICLSSLPQETYQRLDPYFGYTPLMASTQGYIHRAEYLGKRLAGRKAVHAGTSDGLPMNTKDRKFGLLYYDTPDGSYKTGVDFFVKTLREQYGVELAEVLAYPSDLAESAEAARPLIQRLKNSGVTTVLFSGDFINPATYTREATNQVYFPEWIITGSALTDTSIFARTYDPTQWQRAFGISFLTARVPDEFNDAFKLWNWHFGNTDIPAENQFKTIYPSPAAFFTGVHLAGPNLTPKSWQAGLFSYPLTGVGRKTSASISYGNQGVWPFTDYTTLDDVTEIWWDPTVTGPDEVGNPGPGMYRYVAGGKRFLPGQHPTTDPVVFTAADSAPTIYDQPPAGEESPSYPHPSDG